MTCVFYNYMYTGDLVINVNDNFMIHLNGTVI